MFFPNRKTGGKDKFRVRCGTPKTRSLVLFGLINRKFVEHYFAISRRSLLRSESATLMSVGRRVKSRLVSPTQSMASHFFGTKRRSLPYNVNKTGPSMEPQATLTVSGRGSDRSLPILTTCLRNYRQLLNQARAEADATSKCSFDNKLSCWMLSKALDMQSSTTTDICFHPYS